jgi:hypothetical protein
MRCDTARFISTVSIQDMRAYSVLFFVGTEYPFLFFMQLRKKVQSVGLAVELLDASLLSIDDIKIKLETQFLGQSCVYMVTALEQESSLLSYLAQYQGPHTVILYGIPEQRELFESKSQLSKGLPAKELEKEIVEKELPAKDLATQSLISKKLVIDLPDFVDKTLFTHMARWFDLAITPGIERFIGELFKRCDTLGLEQACMLMHYVPLGVYEPLFFEQWLEIIITPAQSMFNLSQYLFQKNGDRFFLQWKAMADTYSAPFWISFWSEQLWRASMLVFLNKQKKYTDARKIAFRLPFSFINRDWQGYSFAELAAAHDFMYRLDWHVKNGGSDLGLDLFYARFLSGSFSGRV